MAFDPALATVVLRSFVEVVSRWLRRRARAHCIRGTLKTGGVTVIQRFAPPGERPAAPLITSARAPPRDGEETEVPSPTLPIPTQVVLTRALGGASLACVAFSGTDGSFFAREGPTGPPGG